jgi:hypothetical protein
MDSTEAIILGISPYGESTLILHLLTRELGVIRAMVKGALRTHSRSQASFDPLTRVHVNVRLKNPDSLGVIGDIRPLDNWAYLHVNMTRYAYAAAGVEIIGNIAATTGQDPFYFEESCRYMELLEHAAGPGSLMIILLVRLLHHSGFVPRVPENWSPESIPDHPEYRFDTQTFSVGSSFRSEYSMPLTGKALAPLVPAIKNPPGLNDPFQVTAPDGILLLQWLVRVWEDHLNTRFKSIKFLREMVWNKSSGDEGKIPYHD